MLKATQLICDGTVIHAHTCTMAQALNHLWCGDLGAGRSPLLDVKATLRLDCAHDPREAGKTLLPVQPAKRGANLQVSPGPPGGGHCWSGERGAPFLTPQLAHIV